MEAKDASGRRVSILSDDDLVEIEIELPGYVMAKLKKQAAMRGLPIDVLASLWLREAIDSDLFGSIPSDDDE